ncbi:MAG: hypothetical protein PHS82_05970 [Lachnospiraceae bacterium]|nr:hypothetical protein [Lachnospiraceae bacterium]
MKAKIRQFLDYYVVYVIVAVVVLGFVGYFVKTVVFDRKDVVLSVMILNDDTTLDTDQMEADLREKLNITDDKQDITLSVMDSTAMGNNAVILTRLRAQSVDLLITDQKAFDVYTEGAAYANLNETLSDALREQLQDGFVDGRAAIYDNEGNVTEYEDALLYGVDISDSERYQSYGSALTHVIAGIAVNAEHKEMAAEAMVYLYED